MIIYNSYFLYRSSCKSEIIISTPFYEYDQCDCLDDDYETPKPMAVGEM